MTIQTKPNHTQNKTARKLKLQMQMTIDGYVAGPNGESDWMEIFGDEVKKDVNDLIDSVDTILMGRKMTQGFVTYWESVVNNQPDSPEFLFAKKMQQVCTFRFE